jgi:uncharacterized protein YifE (UPF0438 family)
VAERVHTRRRVPQGFPPVTDATVAENHMLKAHLQAMHDSNEELRQQLAFFLDRSDQELKQLYAKLAAL